MDYEEDSWSDDYYDEYLDRAEAYYGHASGGPSFKPSGGGTSYQSENQIDRHIENSLSKGFKGLGLEAKIH
jgi:hypothetical protein